MRNRISSELVQLRAAGAVRNFHPVGDRSGRIVQFKGKQAVDFASWDYLGLATHDRVVRAAQQDIERHGVALPSARLNLGSPSELLECESRIARFMTAEAALVFPSRNQVVMSLFAAILREGDVVLFDESTQAPVGDAGHLINAQPVPYATGDLQQLELALERAGSRTKLVFVESVSPLTGKVADLGRCFVLARSYGASVVVDESCALGSLGLRGSGACELAGVPHEPLARVASASFGLGAYAGILCGGNQLIELLRSRSRSFSDEHPLPSSNSSALAAAIDLCELQLVHRERLQSVAERVRAAVLAMGVATLGTYPSPIVCIPFSKRRDVATVAELLWNKGVLVDPVFLQAARSERSALRIVLSASHTDRQVEQLIAAISELLPKFV